MTMHVLHTFANNDRVPYLSWFAERAAQEGAPRYTFLLMYPEPPRMMAEMRALGFACEWIPYDDAHRKRGMLLALPKLWSYMRRYRPDIVHCNLFDDSVPGLIAAKAAGIKVRVISKQETGYHWLHTPGWMAVDRLNDRLATHVIAISGESRDFLLDKEGVPPAKVTLVHNGIPETTFTRRDPALMAQMRERFGLQGGGPVFGTVARFIPWKGLRYVVDAAHLVVREHPDAVFLLCGSGAEEAALRQAVEAHGLQRNVVFTGRLEPGDMPSFYGLLDAYVHAAVLEPFGLVYPEAMMNGVPVVSTATGAARDAIEDGRNGILVAEASGAALAEGIARLLAADGRAIGAAGRTTALDMYRFDRMWQGTMDLYRKALNK